MNDELKDKSGKVRMVYVHNDDDSNKRTRNPRIRKGGGHPGAFRAEGSRRPARYDRKGPDSKHGRERGRDRDAKHDHRRGGSP